MCMVNVRRDLRHLMSVAAPEISVPGSTAPDVVQSDNFVTLLFDEKSKGGTYEIGSNTKIDTDSKLVKAVFNTVTPNTALQLELEKGVFKKCVINGSNENDSIVIGADAETKGKLKVDFGGGSNTIEFKEEPGSKCVIKNVDADDVIIVNGNSFDIDDAGELKDSFNIKLKFADS